jgi:hypothetical protein
VWRKAKYILQKLTPKIKQPTIQLVISQLFQKLKSSSTNKQGLKLSPPDHFGTHHLRVQISHLHQLCIDPPPPSSSTPCVCVHFFLTPMPFGSLHTIVAVPSQNLPKNLGVTEWRAAGGSAHGWHTPLGAISACQPHHQHHHHHIQVDVGNDTQERR